MEPFSQVELQLAARNHGMPLEALRYPITPVGLHYLLIHYDIPQVDPAAFELLVGGLVSHELVLSLDDMGVEYELVPGPLRRKNRDMIESLSGQRKYPVIQFENGSVYREESRDMERTIRDGKLMDRAGAAATAQPSG